MRVNTFHFIGRALFASLFVAAIFNVVNAAAYTVTFNSTFGEFDDGSTTNIVEYNDDHTVKSGEYKEPTYNTGVDSSDFIAWYSEYDAKNRVNLDEISSDTTVYAAYEKITWRWGYTGGEQSFSLPITAGLQLHVWGAQGGTIPGPLSIDAGQTRIEELSGGYGGYSTGLYDFRANQNIYINVGGQGSLNTGRLSISDGGYNGGGTGGIDNQGHLANARSTGGGGATHVATESGILSALEDKKDSVAIVAGGGGGKYYFRNDTYWSGINNGHGGGHIGGYGFRWGYGTDGRLWWASIVSGGSQTAAGNARGSFGQGANAPASYGEQGGGGGGWYGGDAITYSAGGGSGYIGNSVPQTRHMATYIDDAIPTINGVNNAKLTTDTESIKTIKAPGVSAEAVADYAKLGNGYAMGELTRLKITYVNDLYPSDNAIKDQYVGSLAQELYITPRIGYTAAWYKGDTVWNFDDPVNFDTTLEVKYTPTVYDLTYNLNDGILSEPNPSTYTIESSDIALNNPSKDYYTFLGWSGTDLEGGNNENVTIVSGSIGDREYTANFAPIEYSITYELNGGENSTRNPSSYNVESSIRLADAYREGYDFLGWAEGNTIAPGEHGDKTFTAQFEIKHYDVTVNYEGSEVFNDIIDHGSDFPTLNIPEVAPGYERKYYNNGNEYGITQPVTSDLDTTVVDEIIHYAITYVMDGHTNSANNPTSYTVEDADIVLEDAEPKAYYYYYFLGWTTNPNTEEDLTKDFTIPSGSTEDITLYAIFQQNPYTIDFNCEDFCEFEPITKIGEEPIGELPTPEREGYIFLGWFIDDNKLEPTSTPRSSATATARWEKIEAPNTSDSIITFAAIFTLSVFTLLFITKNQNSTSEITKA